MIECKGSGCEEYVVSAFITAVKPGGDVKQPTKVSEAASKDEAEAEANTPAAQVATEDESACAPGS